MAETPLREAYTEAALEELLDIEAYLEAQRPGLGERFRGEFGAALALLLEFPEAAPVVSDSGIRRRVLLRFPYAILYVPLEGTLLVLAVAHTSRPPRFWEDRL